ncbi:MAG: DotH/IcmK family type IV secretion protein [Alphaproteobacteria bacterium]
MFMRLFLSVGLTLLMGAPVWAAGPASNVPPPPSPAALEDPSELMNAANEAAVRASAQAQADEAKAAEAAQMKQQIFENIMAGMMPLTPDQIREFMRRLEVIQEASLPPAAGLPKGEIKTYTLSLDPGIEPPQIDLAVGYVSTLTFVDSTGMPWPIADMGIAGSYEIQTTDKGSHIARIVPMTRYGYGNLSVVLVGLSTPIIFRLSSGTASLHWRYDARVPKYGPNAKMPIINQTAVLSAGDERSMMFLDNSPPPGAKKMHVVGVDRRTTAWQYDNKVYVRTPLSLLSPAWDASVSSSDGMTVYQVGSAPVLLMSDAGVMVRARLAKEEDND